MRLTFRFEKVTSVHFASGSRALPLLKTDFMMLDPNAPVDLPRSTPRHLLPAGESCKRWSELEKALAWLASHRAERSHRLIAVGGGAALDLAGMTASLYRRGMTLIFVPTTLLGMVDATLGGKTAIDREGKGANTKNFAGTFFPADEVWIVPGFLGSLPKRERISGAGEVLKTLWLAGKSDGEEVLLKFVKTGKVTPALVRLIRICLETKREIVEQDPLDTKRLRECLNYGHTVGHALEALARGRLSHGECVLWGMAVESGLAKRGAAMRKRVVSTNLDLGLKLPREFSLPAKEWLRFLRADKKTKDGLLELSLLSSPGEIVRKRLSPEKIAEVIRAFPEFVQL